MKCQKYLLEIVTTLSSTNGELRNCLKSNMILRELKCRLKIFQKTRWTGVINILLSNKRAYEKGAFDEGVLECPIDLSTIELYIQILLPAYFVTLNWEKNHTSIAEVIPAVLYLINEWDKMEIDDRESKELCYFLIHFARSKFKYELDSKLYQVKIFL